MRMEAPVTARTALLQALRDGAGYGRELIERVRRISGGKIHLSEARVYPVLQSLARQGLLRSWEVAPRGRRGARSRTYYELTLRGVEASREERALLAALVGRSEGGLVQTRPDPEQMARWILEADELSVFGEELRSAGTRRRG